MELKETDAEFFHIVPPFKDDFVQDDTSNERGGFAIIALLYTLSHLMLMVI